MRVEVYHSRRQLYEVEVEAPSLEAIRENWDKITHDLIYESEDWDLEKGEKYLSGEFTPEPPDPESTLLPEIEWRGEKTGIRVVEGKAVQITIGEFLGHHAVDVYSL